VHVRDNVDQILVGLRPFNESDITALAQLLSDSQAWPPGPPPAPEDILLRWQRRNVHPDFDVNVLPGPAGQLLAFNQTALLKDGTSRLAFEIAVLPSFRGRGIGAALYKLIEVRARNAGVSHLTAPIYCPEGATPEQSERFLTRRGFRADHSYWQMSLDNISAEASPVWPRGIACRVFSDPTRDVVIWADLIVRAFTEPATAAGVRTQLEEPGVSSDGYFFAVDAATGQEIGTSRGRIDIRGGKQIGYIGTVGVLPEYRGRGIAEALIRQTLGYLASRGMNTATLFVEDRNTAARHLYDKLGWKRVYRTDHYWKRATY
jgi:mycothiol synthase